MPNSEAFAPQIFRRDDFLISTEPDRIDVDMVHRYLANESYWARGIERRKVDRAIRYSLCFGVYDCSETAEAQIGFARVVTDFSRFAYLADLFILAHYRGQGLGKWLISCILAHNELQDMIKWMLNTKDAHELYERFGFQLNHELKTYMVFQVRGW